MTDLERRPLVVVHGKCFDGFCAAWVFRKFWGNNDIDFVHAHYGDDPPDTKGRKVWVLDFSYPRDVMIDKVIKPSLRTTVYDHHRTAEADLKDLLPELRKKGLQRTGDKIIFDMNRSGAGITYDELEREAGKKIGIHTPRFNGQRKIRLVDYIEDRDLWNWKLPDSKAVSAYVSTVPMTFEDYDKLGETMSTESGVQEIVKLGHAIQGYIDEFGRRAIDMARWEQLGQYHVPCINVPYMNCSDHVGRLAEMYPEAPFAVGYFRNLKGQWQFSLRSRGDFDVSEVAKTYGGGGHKNAGGFQVDSLPWTEMPLKPKDDSHKSMPNKMPFYDENPPDGEVDLDG